MAGKKHSKELSTDEIKRVMNDLKEMGVWAFDIVGGEPLLRPDLFEIFEYAKKIDLRVMMNTNGTLVTERTVEKIIKSNPDVMLGVSLDGPDPETNDFVRGKGSFEKATKALKLFADANLDPVILNVINKRNWRKFEDMIKLAKDLGVKKIYVDRFIPVGRGLQSKHLLDMSDEEWAKAIKHVRNIMDKYSDEMVFYVEENITGDPCTAGITHASILADGNVVPCGHFRYNKELYMGNIRENSFKDIWDGYDPEKSLPVPPICKNCPFLKSCSGGCRAVSLHTYGTFQHEDTPLCMLKKASGDFDIKSWGW